MNTPSHLGRKAFSLVEILVSIGIIAVLATVTTPLIQGAITRAHIAQSTNNLREISNISKVYVNDNDGQYPPVWNKETGKTWLDILWPYAQGDRKNPGLGAALRGTVFYTPLLEKGVTARSYGMNLALEDNNKNRRYQFLPNSSRIALFGDTAASSTLSPSQIHARNAGSAGVAFVDGHVSQVPKDQIPKTVSDIFWNGKM